MRPAWCLLGAVVAVQIAYPVTDGAARSGVTIATVLLGSLLAVVHAWGTRGPQWMARFCLVITGGSALVEAVGVASGWPFGEYEYLGGLGPRVMGVPLVVPLAWTMMAYPAWLAALRLASRPGPRIIVAGWALAAWDLFLDPQMVDDHRWVWQHPDPALPGVSEVPLMNYAGWLVVSLALMAAVAVATGSGHPAAVRDLPAYAFYLWTYLGSIAAHAFFLGLPASALWGGLAMGLVAVPLAASLGRRSPGRHAGPGRVQRRRPHEVPL